MEGEGIVNLAVFFVTDFRNLKSSIMIGLPYFSLLVTCGIGGCSSVPPNLGPGLIFAVGDRVEPDLFLLPYSFFNGAPLELDISLFPGLGEPGRPQETANLIRSE